MSSYLIIVTGMPGSGKTTLARTISKELSVPLIEKDYIKEKLFDDLGWSDRGWSKKVGIATYGLMDYLISQLLANKQSLIIESNFKPEFDNKKFQQWKATYNCKIIQIVCSADRQVLYDRFMSRAKSGDRHPGHADAESEAEWREYFFNPNNKIESLDVESLIIDVNTTDFTTVSTENIVSQIKSRI